MSGTGDQKVPPQQQEYYPPPPPGPPPAHANPLGSNPAYDTQQQSVPQHPDENPIPDYHPTAQQQQQHYYQPNAAELYGTDDPRPTAETKASSWSTRLAELGTKAAAPFNSLTTKLGTEAFLPAPMDKECEKAARILRAFCKDGVYHEPSSQQAAPLTTDYKPAPGTTTAPPPAAAEQQHKKKSHVLLKIPPKVIARAQGLAIFTTVRAGFHVSGSSGSGILVARLPDGSWSPPSGIQVHSVGAGFVVGLDIYDCVVVINTREALDAFTRTRMSLGTDLAVAAGQWGAGGALDFEFPSDEEDRRRRAAATTGTAPPNTATAPPLSAPEPPSTTRDRKPSPFRDALKKPLYSYVRSRGFYAGVQIDGTVVTERRDANAAFYGDGSVTVDRILRGDVRPQPGPHQWPAAARGLIEVLVGIDEGARAAASKSHGHHGQAGHGHGGKEGYVGPTRDLDAASAQQQQPQTHEQSAKAAEAAAEARANEPPSYHHHHEPPTYQHEHETHHETHHEAHHNGEELPPAYADEHGAPRPGAGDVKGAGGQ